MAKREEKQNEALEEFTKLTNKELQELDREVIQAGGEEAYLIAKKAIRVVDGQWRVIRLEDGTFPYSRLSRELSQLGDYKARKQAAEDYEVERATGVNPRAERMKRILGEVREVTLGKNHTPHDTNNTPAHD